MESRGNYILPTEPRSIALITGASSGLGAEFAKQLAEKQYDLILVARRELHLKSLAQDLAEMYGINVDILPADLSKVDEIEKVVSKIKATSGLDLLINNAGFGLLRRFLNADPAKELSQLQVHVTAPVMFCRAALPIMITRNKGAIINVASMAGIIPIRSVLYGTTKSFLIAFSRALREEIKEYNIHIQALCPGFFFSEFHDTPEYSGFKRSRIPKFLWMESQQVVKESLQALDTRKFICIPGRFYRFIGFLARNPLFSGLITIAARLVLRRRN